MSARAIPEQGDRSAAGASAPWVERVLVGGLIVATVTQAALCVWSWIG